MDRVKKNQDDNFFKGMVCSSFNIQYQSTGVGSLSSLDEIDEEKVYWVYFKCIEFDIIVVQKNNLTTMVFSPQSTALSSP